MPRLVSFRGLIQNFLRASLPLLIMGVPPPPCLLNSIFSGYSIQLFFHLTGLLWQINGQKLKILKLKCYVFLLRAGKLL